MNMKREWLVEGRNKPKRTCTNVTAALWEFYFLGFAFFFYFFKLIIKEVKKKMQMLIHKILITLITFVCAYLRSLRPPPTNPSRFAFIHCVEYLLK